MLCGRVLRAQSIGVPKHPISDIHAACRGDRHGDARTCVRGAAEEVTFSFPGYPGLSRANLGESKRW